MLISIRTIPHSRQRYPTVGDWRHSPDGARLMLRISKLRDRRSEIGVIVHELVEALLCEHAEISADAVDDWDMGPVGSELEEPGADKRAPYHHQHLHAENVERMVVRAMGLSWTEHCENVDNPLEVKR